MRLFFFFSSRRRHTSWPRDWSSDVCSSDLVPPARALRQREHVAAIAVDAHEIGIEMADAQVDHFFWGPFVGFAVFAGSVSAYARPSAIHFLRAAPFMAEAGTLTYSFICRPGIGSNGPAPAFADFARPASSSRTAIFGPNVKANMFPFTKSAG